MPWRGSGAQQQAAPGRILSESLLAPLSSLEMTAEARVRIASAIKCSSSLKFLRCLLWSLSLFRRPFPNCRTTMRRTLIFKSSKAGLMMSTTRRGLPQRHWQRIRAPNIQCRAKLVAVPILPPAHAASAHTARLLPALHPSRSPMPMSTRAAPARCQTAFSNALSSSRRTAESLSCASDLGMSNLGRGCFKRSSGPCRRPRGTACRTGTFGISNRS